MLLPAWCDCYEYAARVEYLGIGIYGNKEWRQVLRKRNSEMLCWGVMGEKGSETQVGVKARELGLVCRRSGGRRKVTEMISEIFLENKSIE